MGRGLSFLPFSPASSASSCLWALGARRGFSGRLAGRSREAKAGGPRRRPTATRPSDDPPDTQEPPPPPSRLPAAIREARRSEANSSPSLSSCCCWTCSREGPRQAGRRRGRRRIPSGLRRREGGSPLVSGLFLRWRPLRSLCPLGFAGVWPGLRWPPSEAGGGRRAAASEAGPAVTRGGLAAWGGWKGGAGLGPGEGSSPAAEGRPPLSRGGGRASACWEPGPEEPGSLLGHGLFCRRLCEAPACSIRGGRFPEGSSAEGETRNS